MLRLTGVSLALFTSSDLAVTATGSPSNVNTGDSVTHTITVTNNDMATTASDVTLAVTPSAGIQLSGTTFASSQGTCDPAVNICMRRAIPSNGSATGAGHRSGSGIGNMACAVHRDTSRKRYKSGE